MFTGFGNHAGPNRNGWPKMPTIKFELNGVEHAFETAKLPELSLVYGLTRGLREFVRDSYADETEKKHGSEEKALAARRKVAAEMAARIAEGRMPSPGEARGPRDAVASAWRDVLTRAPIIAKAKPAYVAADVPKAAVGAKGLADFAKAHFTASQLVNLRKMVDVLTATDF